MGIARERASIFSCCLTDGDRDPLAADPFILADVFEEILFDRSADLTVVMWHLGGERSMILCGRC